MASNINALRLVDELRELPSKPRSHVLLILVFMLFNGFVLASNSVVLPIYLRDATKMSVTQVSLLLSEVVALFAVTQAVVGFLVDIGVRLVGRKWMLLRVAIIWIVGWLLLVAAPTRFGLWIVGFLFGLGAGATPLALSVLADNIPVSKAGLFANIMTSFAVVGQFLAMIASVVVIGTVGARWYYTIGIVPFALIFLVMLFKLPDAPRPSSAGGGVSVGAAAMAMAGHFADPETRAIKVVSLLMSAVSFSSLFYLSLFTISLVKSDALSAVYISSYTSVALAAVLIMGPIIGAYSDRHQNKARVLLGLLVVSSVCILAIHSTSLPLVAALFAAIAVFALQVTDSTVNALLMAVAYRYERGDKTTFLIANRIPPFIGHLSGVVLSGLVINATGSVAASLVVMAALSVLSVAIWADSTFRGGYAERVASLKGSN